MTENEVYKKIQELRNKHPELRKGQCAFNIMMEYNPDKAEELRATELDPFYHDERTHTFILECLNVN